VRSPINGMCLCQTVTSEHQLFIAKLKAALANKG